MKVIVDNPSISNVEVYKYEDNKNKLNELIEDGYEEEDDNDSNFDSTSLADEPSKPSFKRTSIDKPLNRKNTMKSEKEQIKKVGSKNDKNLFKLASSLRCIPSEPEVHKNHVRIAEQDSLTSEENLLEDVGSKMIGLVLGELNKICT